MPFNKVKVLEATLDAAVKILEITDDVLETTPIPGAAAVIKVVLSIVKQKERADRNAELTERARQDCEDLINETAKYQVNTENTLPEAPSELQVASEALARQLQGYARELKKATTHKIRPRLMTCADDEEALHDFVDKTSKALARYHHTQGNRIEEYIVLVRDKLQVIDTKVDRIDGMVQEERDESKVKEWNRLIKELPRAELAAYNADRRVGTLSSCSEGTRTTLLEDVASWIADPEAGSVYWLKERAGFGKTAIALSVAEQAAKQGVLAASFFFSYQIPELSDTSRFIPTIVYQLSLFGGVPYKQHFAAAIEKHPDTLDARLKDQLHALLLGPLQDIDLATSNAPLVIVIDALDECEREDAQHLISTFIATLSSLNLPLKVFITSRPEPHLITAFSSFGADSRAVEDTSDQDVETYLRGALATIPRELGLKDLPRDWVTEEDIQSLLVCAGVKRFSGFTSRGTEKGLFVYASTVIRFLSDPHSRDPREHLQIVLSVASPLPYRPYQALDNLYIRVLRVALQDREELLQRYRRVVGGIMVVSEYQILPITALERLLGLREGEVRRTLENLQSVTVCPDTDSEAPSFHHRSFTDFLRDVDRSGPLYHIDFQLQFKHITLRCMQVIATSPLKHEVTHAMKKETYFFYQRPASSPEFMHASYYIKDYFGGDGDKDLLDALERFIKHDFGWWIELFPYFGSSEISRISNDVDPQDERALPILFRALGRMKPFGDGDMELDARVCALARKELRRYISAVTEGRDHPDDETRIEAHAMISSVKEHINQLIKQFPPRGELYELCQAILVFAKAVSATVDAYQLSIGNQEEVEGSRKRTMFLRRKLKHSLVKIRFIPDDSPFEEEGTGTASAVSVVGRYSQPPVLGTPFPHTSRRRRRNNV